MRKGNPAREACQTARPPAPAGAPEDRRSATPGGAEREPAILRAEWTRGVPPILIYKAVRPTDVIAHRSFKMRDQRQGQRSAFAFSTPPDPFAACCPSSLPVHAACGAPAPSLSLSLSFRCSV